MDRNSNYNVMERDFKRLNSYIQNNQNVEAKNFMLDLSSALTQELHASTIDGHLLNIFDESNGLLYFIGETVNTKNFSDSIVKAFEIIYTITNNFTSNVVKYTPRIRSTCLKVINTSKASSTEKKRAIELLKLILETSDYFPEGYFPIETIYEKLLVCYQLSAGEVLGAAATVIGALIKKYPSVIKEPGYLYLDLVIKFEGTVRTQSKQESVLAGLIFCLTDFLEVYSNFDIQQLYRSIKEYFSNKLTYNKTGYRACFKLITKHTHLLSNELFTDIWWWKEKLSEWLDFKGDDCKTAYYTLDALYQRVSKCLTVEISDTNSKLCEEIISSFVETINNPLMHGYKLRLAIRGLGFFANAARIQLSSDKITTLFIDIVQKIEKIYLLNPDNDSDKLENLPDYIQTLSLILKELPNLTEYEIGILQQSTVLMIKLFPYLSKLHHNLVIDAILMSLFLLRDCKKEALNQFLQNVIYQGVIWTCSNTLLTYAETQNEHTDLITYKNFLPVWYNLLDKKNVAKFEKIDGERNASIFFINKVFYELMATLFISINKLNLSTHLKEDNYITDPEMVLEAEKLNDYYIFINLVDFYIDILDNTDNKLFKKWMQKYISQMIIKANKYPLVSGFYKLLAVGLKVSNDLDYFEEINCREREDVKQCYDSICTFVRNMTLKIKQHKGDLKIACMKVILFAPIRLVRDILPNIGSTFVSLFSIGRTNLRLAEMGIDSLEYWYQNIPEEELEPFLKEVLPSLDSYLTSKSLGEDFDVTPLKTRKTAQILNRRRIIKLTEAELFTVQKRIMTFISHLNNNLCSYLVESDTVIEAVSWNKTPHLKVTLPYGDIKLHIYLDKLIPRIVELALYSTDRKVRINACEVLHSIVMLILGTCFRMNETKAKDLDILLRKISYPLLRLGCDTDLVVQGIFKPLMIQLMHWYSNPQQKFSSHTAVFIEALMDGVTQSEDCAVRDFTCECIKEFIVWTIKQTTETGLKREPINIKIFIRKIKYFSLHTDPTKRLAAALIFNNIYTVLREELYIIDTVWLELLHTFVMNLSLVDEHDQYNCLYQVRQSLNHIERGLVEKCDLFNKPNKERRLPPYFEGVTLKDTALWLLKQTGSINQHCRQKCMELFRKVAPLVVGSHNNIQTFMNINKTFTDTDWMSDLFDHYIQGTPILDDDSVTNEMIVKWMSSLLCALDGHIFIYENKIAPPTYNVCNTKFYQALTYFLKYISPIEIEKFTCMYKQLVLMSIEKEQIKNLKVRIIKKIKDFLILMLQLNKCDDIDQLLTESGWDLLCNFIFENINFNEEEEHDKDINNLVLYLKESCPDAKIMEFSLSLHSYLSNNYKVTKDLKASVPLRYRQIMKGLALLQGSCLSTQLNLLLFSKGIVKNVSDNLLASSNNQLYTINLQDAVQKYCEWQMQFALQNKEEFSTLVQYLSDQRLVKNSKNNELENFGSYIFDLFKSVIVKYLVIYWKDFCDFVVPLLSPQQIISFIHKVLTNVALNRNSFENTTVKIVIEEVSLKWEVMKALFDTNIEQRILGLEMIEKMSRLVTEDMKSNLHIDEMHNWVISCMKLENISWCPQYVFKYITHIINVLPLAIGSYEENKLELVDGLLFLQEKYFTSIPQSALDAATIAINKSFQIATVSKSKIIFKFACSVFALGNLSSEELNIDQICKMFAHNLNKTEQTKLLHDLYKLCTGNLQWQFSYKLTKDVLTCLLRYVKYLAFEQFYVDIMKQVTSSLHLNNSSLQNMLRKTIDYILIEILFLRININNFENKSCPITEAAYSPVNDGKELLKNFTKRASNALKEDVNELSPDLKEYFRIYQCHCYNALVSVISNTQTKEGFYSILFSREVNGENVLWRNLIDDSKDYTFEMDFDKLPKQTKSLVSIRTSLQQERKKLNNSQTLRYIESQNVFDSTLSEDICKYDLTRCFVRHQPRECDDSDTNNNVEMEIDIDSVQINSHECMATLCCLFQHMVETELIDLTNANPQIPKWMVNIKNDLKNPKTSRNVKLFLVKMIENMKHVFKPFAKEFFKPIAEVILDKHAGSNINYFVAELVVMLISWFENRASADEQPVASKLLEFLMMNVNADRADIMKYDLELVKTFVETWKPYLDVPTDYVLLKLSSTLSTKKPDVVIHLCAILLANKLAPWQINTLKDCAKHLCKTLDADNSSVYRPSAEVIGMALEFMQANKKCSEHLNDFVAYITKKLENIRANENKRLYILQGIMKHYPPVCDRFIPIFIYKFKQMPADFKAVCLKIFLERIETFYNCPDFVNVELNDLLIDYSTEVQIVGLEIVNKIILKLTVDKVLELLEIICNFATSPNHICRSIMYDILMTLYYNYDNKDSSKCSEIVDKCKDVLLQGLTDHNTEIDEKVTMFWLNEKNIPKNIFNRFLFILNNMYKPTTERHYLGYFISFLLYDLNDSEEFTQALFDYQLSECDLREYFINVNWRAKNISLAPMFASTYRSLESEFSMSNYSDQNFLRATQTLKEFEPTVKTSTISDEKMGIFKGTGNNLLIRLTLPTSSTASDGTFKVPYPVTENFKLRKKRFYRDETKVNRGFAFREVVKAGKIEQTRKDLAKQREQGVQLYRNYRTGDYPDIRIKLSDVITPLQKLAKSDTYIARQFYTTLFDSIYENVSLKDSCDIFIEVLVKAINYIFVNSIQYNPNVMGAFLEVALTYKDKIQFHPDVLSKLCQYSGLVSTGSLLLEEYLISGDDESLNEKKERGHTNDPQTNCWVKLAGMYKEMEEWDVVRAIFLEKMNCADIVLKALDAESQGFWKDAQMLYAQVIQQDESLERRDFYFESYYKCFAELSDWEQLSDSIKNTVSGNSQQEFWDELWDQDWNQQKLLPWYLTAELRSLLEDSKQDLLVNLNNTMNDPIKSEYINLMFSEEFAFLWLMQNDIDKSMRYLHSYIRNFLNTWSNLNPLLTSLRANKLITMRNAIDIYDFINKLNMINGSNCKTFVNSICKQWSKLFKENLSSTVSFETRNLYRSQFIQLLKSKISTVLHFSQLEDVRRSLDEMQFDMDINLINLAIKSNNFYVARKYIKKYNNVCNGSITSRKSVTCNLAYSKVIYLKALYLTDPQQQLKLLIEAWTNTEKCLNNTIINSSRNQFIAVNTFVFDLTQTATNILSTTPHLNEFKFKFQDLCEGEFIVSAVDVERFGFKKLNAVLSTNSEDNSTELCKTIAEAYLKIAYFAQRSGEKFTSHLIRSILKSMYFGSSEAIQIFPCLLNIANLGIHHKQTFLEESRQLPEWMYIQWIPQLLANIDSSHVFAIHEIVLNIAKKYPQAIMYAYRLSKQKYTFKDDDVGVFCGNLIQTLDDLLLSNPVVDRLLDALSCVSLPGNVLYYYIKRLIKTCNSKSEKDFKEVIAKLRSLCEEKVSYNDTNSIRGYVFNKISSFAKEIIRLDSKQFDPVKMKHSLNEINSKVDDLKKEKTKYDNKLSYYSPWLEHFSELELNLDLEIPGQYKGDRKPLLQYHAKISGFSSEVTKFHSLRSPIKLTFIGNDAKEYPFVIKFGEDLRQDQRIEQMFGLINNIINNDPACYEKRLGILTYQVIPLTSTLGLIEWVGNTTQLKKFIHDAVPEDGRMEFNNVREEFIKKYLQNEQQKLNHKEAYERALLNKTPDKTIAIYRALVNRFPWDVLRTAIWNISMSSESFVALRRKFITSHATSCIADWILGIGDRHLENSLVSLENGQIFDIDFGHAFGSAVQLLPIPELVPFRLTPHIINLMQPLNEHGLIQETMIHILRALRKNNGSLLATMNVFIKEPSLDWVEIMKYNDDPCSITWSPESKMAQARRKLEGANPATIMIEELNARNTERAEVIAKYVTYVKGQPRDNVRARKEDNLSVEDQVRCLIDHATDYNLLGRMYYGWDPWI